MEGQVMDIYVRTDKWMTVQRCFKYRYEVMSDDSPYCGRVDDIYSFRPLVLSAGHAYTVRVSDGPGAPRVVESLGEIERASAAETATP
jgi:hypothetical protein